MQMLIYRSVGDSKFVKPVESKRKKKMDFSQNIQALVSKSVEPTV